VSDAVDFAYVRGAIKNLRGAMAKQVEKTHTPGQQQMRLRVTGVLASVRAGYFPYSRQSKLREHESTEPCSYAGRFHPWRFILAEIYLCHTYSCHGITRMETPGQAPDARGRQRLDDRGRTGAALSHAPEP
jgi:hypothetical protein